jgi:hypothetical protein
MLGISMNEQILQTGNLAALNVFSQVDCTDKMWRLQSN